MEQLRAILLDTTLQENFKWRAPCYTFEKKNIAIIGNFKAACTPGFFKGALLKYEVGILAKPGKNSNASRMFRFTSVGEIIVQEPLIRAYVEEAIEIEKAGLKIPTKQLDEFEFPEELQEKFKDDPIFENAFRQLTPGRQKGYLLHFNGAKQSKTRMNRIENYTPIKIIPLFI